MPGGLLGQLADLFQRRQGAPQEPAPQDAARERGSAWPQPAQSQPSGTAAQAPSDTQRSSPVRELNDPIVASLNQQLAQEQAQPVPTEAEQLKQEQHQAWGSSDFERCIVIFSRLRALEPDDPTWAEKLKVSYFNRGKQYETEGNEERATQCYYAALSIDPDFEEATHAAEEFVQKHAVTA